MLQRAKNIFLIQICHAELARPPCPHAVETLQKTVAIQGQYWASLAATSLDRVAMSHLQVTSNDESDMTINDHDMRYET